jgi:hypothetical protein
MGSSPLSLQSKATVRRAFAMLRVFAKRSHSERDVSATYTQTLGKDEALPFLGVRTGGRASGGAGSRFE